MPKIAGTAYIYYYLKNKTADIENRSSGTTFKEASGSLMKSLETIIAPRSVFAEFEQKLAPLFAQQENNESESHSLAQLRDTLLPRLMSGDIEVN